MMSKTLEEFKAGIKKRADILRRHGLLEKKTPAVRYTGRMYTDEGKMIKDPRGNFSTVEDDDFV